MLAASLIALFLTAPDAFHEAQLIFPPQSVYNHASSIVETPGGDLLAVWFSGSGEAQSDDVRLVGSRLTAEARAEGKTEWKAPFPMADSPYLPDCNPVLFVDPRGTLWLFWVAIQDNDWGSALLKYRTTNDFEGDGAPNWQWQNVIHARPTNLEARYGAAVDAMEGPLKEKLQEAGGLDRLEGARGARHRKLSRRLGWMTRIHPIMTSDRRLMLGLYSDVYACALAAVTEDWGETWFCSEPIIDPNGVNIGNIQPSFVMKKNGDIVAFMRDASPVHDHIPTSISKDRGKTWSPLSWLDIPNPGSSVECIPLASGNWVLVCNDRLEGRGRHRLTAYLSPDEGATWPWSRALEDCPEGAGNFAYPSVIESRDGLIHCTYSWREKDTEGSSIRHAAFNEAWVMERQVR